MKQNTTAKPTLSKGKLATIVAILLGLAAAALLWSGHRWPGHDHGGEVAKQADSYTCPMHPQIIQDRPGSCPICGMDLIKIEQTPPTGAKDKVDEPSPPADRAILFYRNPMTPSITSPVPAKDEMGMDYIPVYSDETPPATNQDKAPLADGVGLTDLATVRVGEEAIKLSGVQTAIARQETVQRTVRTVGLVVADETRVRHIHTKVNGWIETLATNFTGQAVREGTPLLSLYSPELLTSQQEFVAARQAAAKMEASNTPEVMAMASQLVQAARQRLSLFDVPTAAIERLDKGGAPQRAVTLEAPISGFVTAKGVYEGQQVAPGMELFTITDLSQVWIEADLYEYEASQVKIGQEATLSLSYEPNATLKGQVAYVFPYLATESRTLKVRFNFPNPELKLKPQMYADVTLAIDQAPGVSIPDSAVIDSGLRQVVFVETVPGTFEPRQVKIGVRGEGKVRVVAGVSAGDLVVIKANFLLDSESRLRAAINKAIGGGGK